MVLSVEKVCQTTSTHSVGMRLSVACLFFIGFVPKDNIFTERCIPTECTSAKLMMFSTERCIPDGMLIIDNDLPHIVILYVISKLHN